MVMTFASMNAVPKSTSAAQFSSTEKTESFPLLPILYKQPDAFYNQKAMFAAERSLCDFTSLMATFHD